MNTSALLGSAILFGALLILILFVKAKNDKEYKAAMAEYERKMAEYNEAVAALEAGKAVLLVSLELDEILSLSDRILVIYEGEIVGEFDSEKVKNITVEEIGLYMAGAKRGKEEKA